MTHGSRLLISSLLAAVFVAPVQPARSDEANKDRPESRPTDRVIYTNLKATINRGADLYNSGDLAGCYRLYEGALLVVKPLLEHRPDLQKEISNGLSGAESDPVMWRRAFTLRKTLDRVRADLNPNEIKEKPREIDPPLKGEKLGLPRIDDGKP